MLPMNKVVIFEEFAGASSKNDQPIDGRDPRTGEPVATLGV